MKNPNYKNENIERKYLKTMRNKQFLKINGLLELEKDFIELKDREIKIKREIEELLFKPTLVSVDDMDRIENKRNEENKTT